MPRPPKPIVIINSLTIIVITSRIVLQLQNAVLEMAEADEDLPGVTSAASVPVKKKKSYDAAFKLSVVQ